VGGLAKNAGPALLALTGFFAASKLAEGIKAFANSLFLLRIRVALLDGPLAGLKAGLSALGGLFNPATILAAAFAATIFVIAKAHSDAKGKVDSFAAAIESEANGMKGATDEFILGLIAQKNWVEKLGEAGVSLALFVRAVKGEPDAIARVGEQLNKLGGGASGASLSIDGTSNNLLTLQKNALPLGDVLVSLQQQFAGGAKQAAIKSAALKDLAGSTDKTTTSTKALVVTTDAYIESIKRGNRRVIALQDQLKSLTGVVDHFKSSLDATLGTLLNVQDTTAKYDQDLAALGDALKKNGKSFDLNTQKGRDNSSALRTVVGDIQDQIGALVKSGSIQANDVAQKDALIKRLQILEARYPAVKGQVHDYIAEVNKTPVTKSTRVSVDISGAKAKLNEFQADLKAFGGRIAKQGLLNISSAPIPIAAKIQSISASTVNMTATSVKILNARGLMGGGFLGPGEVGITGEGGKPEITVGGPAGTSVIPLNRAGGFSSQDVDRIIQAIERAIQLSRPITVNEVAKNPVATAESVAARLGLAGVR
jgi:hypothetical protein